MVGKQDRRPRAVTPHFNSSYTTAWAAQVTSAPPHAAPFLLPGVTPALPTHHPDHQLVSTSTLPALHPPHGRLAFTSSAHNTPSAPGFLYASRTTSNAGCHGPCCAPLHLPLVLLHVRQRTLLVAPPLRQQVRPQTLRAAVAVVPRAAAVVAAGAARLLRVHGVRVHGRVRGRGTG